jgi:AraC-like DNA-binding protein
MLPSCFRTGRHLQVSGIARADSDTGDTATVVHRYDCVIESSMSELKPVLATEPGRILVVDDNQDNIEIIATRLRFRGYEFVWYEEQFEYLLGRMIRNEQALTLLPERVACMSKDKRRELKRRLHWSTDYMHSNLHRELTLSDLARAAHLSSYHYLRLFRQAFEMTPMTYLRKQRTQRALALIGATSLEIQEIADQVGFSR